MEVHPSAIVEPGATIGAGCRIGPFCHIGPQVVLGKGCELRSHVVVTGDTDIGAETVIWPFAVIGEVPQDRKFAGEATQLRIGARARIREHVTINTGTAGGGGVTRVGDDGLFLANAHVAHDCQVGDRVTLVNSAALAGHCIIGDDVIIGGLSGVHQWVRIGRGAIIGGVTMVTRDVLPYGLVEGPRGTLDGLNLVGLKRRGLARDEIAEMRAAYAALKDGAGTFAERAQGLAASSRSPLVQEMAAFILDQSDRSFLTPS